jgi:hypothetical protein
MVVAAAALPSSSDSVEDAQALRVEGALHRRFYKEMGAAEERELTGELVLKHGAATLAAASPRKPRYLVSV